MRGECGCDEPVAYDADVKGAVLSHCYFRDFKCSSQKDVLAEEQ